MVVEIRPRVVFMGTSRFAVPSLEGLVQAGYEVVGVVTQPARPAGRGRHLVAAPVSQAATRMGLRLLSPERLRSPESVAELANLIPDLIVVAAYAQILPRAVLEMPRYGCVNVHASLLPRWRGASPIHAAILAGDELAGVSIMLMEPSMDTGAVLGQIATGVEAEDTTPILEERLARAGAALLVDILPCYLSGAIDPVPQNPDLVTYAPIIKKEDGLIDWTQPARAIWRASRAFQAWPGIHTRWEGKILKVVSCQPMEAIPQLATAAGTVLALPAGREVGVATGEGVLVLDEVAPEGGRTMTVREFVAGHRSFVGSRLGS